MGPSYLKEINHPSLIEMIDEKFYGITSLMTDHSLIYGGSVNSIIAGLDIKGDLDISASQGEFMVLAQNISSSTMWVQTDGDNIPERGSSPGRWTLQGKIRMKDYGDGGNLPLNKIAQFETVNGAKVHVLQAKDRTGDFLEDALSIIRAVDLRCCGVGLNKFGQVYEAVEGGYTDCLNRTLMINKYDPLKDAESTRIRIQKYLDRGWQLGTSIETIMENFHKAREEYLRQQAAKSRYRGRRSSEFPKGIVVTSDPKYYCLIKIYRNITDITGFDLISDVIRKEANNQFSCAVNVITTDKGYIILHPAAGYKMDVDQANKVMRRTLYILSKNYKIDLHAGKPKKPTTKSYPQKGYSYKVVENPYTVASFSDTSSHSHSQTGDPPAQPSFGTTPADNEITLGDVESVYGLPAAEDIEEVPPSAAEVFGEGPFDEIQEEEDSND